MNAILDGLFVPSQVLHFLELDLEQVRSGGVRSLPGAGTADPLDRRSPRLDVDRARLDGEPWRPHA